MVYPGNLIGGLIAQGVIGKLPAQYLQSRESKTEERVSDWPIRWRNLATYGGQLYGIPLGSPPLGAIARNLDPTPVTEIEKSLASSKLATDTSIVFWEKFLAPLEAVVNKDEQSGQIENRMNSLTDAEKNRLVDCFMWIASTTDARRKGLFDLLKMQSRMHQPEFVTSSVLLARIVRVSADGILAEPAQAWSQAWNANANHPFFAIGYPGTVDRDMTSDAATTVANNPSIPNVLTWIWNNDSGLVVSVAKNTRQTSVSCSFLEWLASGDHREALRLLTSRIELLPNQSDRNLNRADAREYQTLLTRSYFNHGMDLSLRFANGDQYRKKLADYLVRIIRAPDQAQSIMLECSSAWNELTNQLGMEKQRISVEQSLGLNR